MEINTHKRSRKIALLAALILAGAGTAAGITIDTVTVGNINNAANSASCGSVGYEYQIGKYEVTNAQYAEFLNAVVGTGADTCSLYNSNMNGSHGGITRNGDNVFEVKSGWGNKAVNWVSFYDAARFVNWLTNGQGSGSTETGLYMFDGVANLVSTPDHAAAAAGSGGWVIANENEWYKAAYYNPTLNGGTGGYTNYPWTGGTAPSHTRDAVNGANYSGGSGNVADVGYYVNAKSYYGTHDQAGNLSEWNDTIWSGASRVTRGGSFNSIALSISASNSRSFSSLGFESNSLGFRVASLTAVPEPGVMAGAMGLAALVVGIWVRRRQCTR